MNPDWKSHLEQISTPFAPSTQLPACGLFDLSHLELIRVEGEDAQTFMQGQFTNDSRQLSYSRSQLSALCTPKGRMLGLFRIAHHQGGWLLQLPAGLRESVQKRLQMFVLRAKVQISDASGQTVALGLAGECAEALVAELCASVPTNADDQISGNGIDCVRLGGPTPRFLLLMSSATALHHWLLLAAKATPASQEAWKLLAIRAGEPAVYAETLEAFVPQMVNLQLVNGLSFKKGCYTGQEVVARMQYLGKLKRRMFRARVESSEELRPGAELFSPESTSGQGAGRVVEVAQSAAGVWELLAVMEIALTGSAIHLASLEGPRLEILDLPYAIPENSQ